MRPGFSDKEIAEIFTVHPQKGSDKIKSVMEPFYKMWRADTRKAMLSLMHFMSKWDREDADEIEEQIEQQIAEKNGRADRVKSNGRH